ncbi:predicted protein [Nematostella vectensis]|uniref:LON peptidase N-terminal domain and RING finger protein 3 n=1 Tax=Nematostella vectensis TaxID=45351 RepID=A7RFA4_NEMVE|nr:predicted protein [Nematostella vectensis]|eukprot:XP_001641984.1 predicted protein [Nematostella vectensis]
MLRNFPQDLNSRCWRSDCFLKLGYPEIALRDIEIASAARPDLLRVLHRKARVLSRLTEDTEQVIILLLRSVKFESPVNEYEEMAVDFTRESYSSEKSCLSPSSPEQEMSELNGTQSPKVDNGATKDCNDLFSENLENGDIRSPASNTEQLDDFECKLCFNLLLEPVTSLCGHSFCRDCLYRSLDHRVECPCCRAPLTKILAERRQAVTSVLDGMIKDFFPVQYEKRKNLYAAEMEELRRGIDGSGTIPIFICTLAFPTVQCPLHIFEPRYRLMIRRCVESGSRRFGMCTAGDDPSKPFATFGTMLKIKDVQYLQDGRSIINTIGTRRFSVQSYNMKDGYYVAKVKWVKDDVEEDVEEKAEIQKATLTGFAMLQLWFNSLNEEQQKCITDAIGPMPNCDPNMHVQQDGPEWVWWSLAALPLQDKPKLIILAMKSTIERLRSIQRFLMLMIQMQKRANPPKVST